MNHRPNYHYNIYGTYPRKMSDFEMQQSSAFDEYNLVTDPQQLRGILRKNREQYPSHPSMFLNDNFTSNTLEPKFTVRGVAKKESTWNSFFHAIIQPCVAEFLAICISTFIWKHIDSQLAERQVSFFTRVLLLAGVDAACIGIFVSAFETVQLNPAITISQLFSLTTPWYLCLLLLIIQFLGAFSGIVLFYFVHTGIIPTLPALVIDINGDFSSSIVCQFIGNFVVCISFLIVTQSIGSNRLYVARLVGNPFSVVSAVTLSSFLSLLHSNVGWNPVNALVLSAFHYFKSGGNSMPWHNHYVFWVGPIIGSLCSCFVYRFILAPINRRIQCNQVSNYSV